MMMLRDAYARDCVDADAQRGLMAAVVQQQQSPSPPSPPLMMILMMISMVIREMDEDRRRRRRNTCGATMRPRSHHNRNGALDHRLAHGCSIVSQLPKDCFTSLPIKMVADFMSELWSSAHCADCTPDEYAMFQQFAHNFTECMDTAPSESAACVLCSGPFRNLQAFYDGLSGGCNNNVDFIDLIFAIEQRWYGSGCEPFYQHSPQVIGILSLFLSLPVFYYGLSYAVTLLLRRRALASKAAA